MITIQDWIAVIPEEDKHIAYVGENATEQRQYFFQEIMRQVTFMATSSAMSINSRGTRRQM